MRSVKGFVATGLALILCVFLAACGGGGSKPTPAGAPVVLPLSLPNGAINVPYSAQVGVAQGTGTPPFTLSITAGSLPPGLSLNDTNGALTGTPTTIGKSSFTITATDAKSLTGSRALSINIRGAINITQSALPSGQVGLPYTATLTATGGVVPYIWSVNSGSLPAGLTLTSNPDGTATISGTPTTLGSSSFSVQVSDSESPPATGVSAPFSIYIEGSLTITTASLPAGNVAIFYDSQLMVTGGLTPYTWTITSGSLPPGLTLTPSTGVISGTPTTVGTSMFTVQVADSESTPATTTGSFTITIAPTPPLQITTSSLPAGTQGVTYSSTLAATGGVPPYSWTLAPGSMLLPKGLTLSGTGVIGGTPVGSADSFPITVQVTDTLMHTETADLTLVINAGALVIINTALPGGTVSVPYDATMGAAGGTPPYSWSVVGVLPAGLSLSSSTGLISGMPSTPGTSPVQVQVQDSASHMVVSRPFAVAISPPLTNAALTGNYAFSFSGYNNNVPVFMAGRFTADGSGTISNGLLDMNSSSGPPATSVAFTGTYSINPDLSKGNGLGTMTFNPAQGPPLVFAVAITSNGSGRLIQSDPGDLTAYGSGAIEVQTIVNLSGGNFVLGSTGVDAAGGRYASAGAFQVKASGSLNSGVIDINDAGALTSGAFLGGSYSTADLTTGRGTASLIVNSSQAENFSYYVVSASEIIQISTDQLSGNSPLTLATVFRSGSTGVTLTNGILKGTSIVETNAVNPNGGTPQAVGTVGTFTGDGTADGNGFGNATFLVDQNTGGTIAQQQVSGGQYKVNALTGRVTLNGFGGTPPVLYVINQGQAFLIGADANATSGLLTPQVNNSVSGTPFSNGSIFGTYVGGSVTPALPSVTNQVDWVSADGNTNINFSQDSSGPGGPQPNQFAVTYEIDATGRALIYSNPGDAPEGVLFVVSPAKFVILSPDANPVLSTFVSGKSTN